MPSFVLLKQNTTLSRDFLEFVPRCQWPNIHLPVPQVVPPPQPPAPNVNEEVLKGLQTTHDAAVNMLCTQGIDACKVYKERCCIHPGTYQTPRCQVFLL